MNDLNQQMILTIKPRPTETVAIAIPKDTLDNLKKIADDKEMSLDALLKFYIGQGLRQDLSKSTAI